MKILITLSIIILNTCTWGQTTVKFGYDLAGNRTSTILVKTHADSLSKSTDESSLSEMISVYPVPTSNIIFMEFTEELCKNTVAHLCTINGGILSIIHIEKPRTEINLSWFPDGIYLLKIYFKDKSYCWKIIKKI